MAEAIRLPVVSHLAGPGEVAVSADGTDHRVQSGLDQHLIDRPGRLPDPVIDPMPR
jgi:hypothetical protein